MPSIALPTGTYNFPEPKASVRRLVNCFAELAPNVALEDAKNKDTPVILRRAPGIVDWADDGTSNPVRCMHMMQGVLYAVIGPVLYSVSQGGNLTQIGTGIPGSGLVRMADNGSCLVVLVPETNLAYTYISNPVITSFSLTPSGSGSTPGGGLLNTTITPGLVNNSVDTGMGTITTSIFGYISGSIGSVGSASITGGYTLNSAFYLSSNQTFTVGINGFTSDPTQAFLGTFQIGSTTYQGTTASYSYNSGSASWIFPAASLNVVEGQTVPLVINGTGSTGTGATSGTLGLPWPYSNANCSITFTDGEVRVGSFVYGSTNVTWTVNPLTGSPAGITQIKFLSSFNQIEDETFLQFGAIDCWYIDSYIVFLAQNGMEFYNSDSTTVSTNGPITFTGASEFPREFGTDPFVAGIIDHRQIILFGQLTSEVFIDAGNVNGSPFDSAPQNFMQMGAVSGFTVAQQNQTVYWLANDRTVRQLNGIDPVKVSNYGIENILEQANIIGAFAFSVTVGGHMFYVLTLPNEPRTLVYDAAINEWHELASSELGYWRPNCSINAYGYWLVGDSLSGKIGYLDTSVFTEWGATRTATWIHQPIYQGHNRLRHQRLEIVMGAGSAPLGLNPLLTLQISDDGGETWRTMTTRSLGLTGHYQQRAVWYQLGMARDRVYQFNLSDPVESWVTDAQLDYLPASH